MKAEQQPPQEFDWEEVKRVKRPARFAGELDAVLILLRGKKRRLQKMVSVPDHLNPTQYETAAIFGSHRAPSLRRRLVTREESGPHPSHPYARRNTKKRKLWRHPRD